MGFRRHYKIMDADVKFSTGIPSRVHSNKKDDPLASRSDPMGEFVIRLSRCLARKTRGELLSLASTAGVNLLQEGRIQLVRAFVAVRKHDSNIYLDAAAMRPSLA